MAILFSGFVLAGVVTTLLGPLVPWLSARWALSDAAAGLLFTAQFCGGLAGGAASGWVAGRLSETRTIALGFAGMSAGVAALALGDRAVGAAGALAAGVGLGLVIPLTNLLVARLRPQRAAAALSALNLAWGAGAMLWPLALAAAGAVAGAGGAVLILSALLAATSLRLAAVSAPAERPSPPIESAVRSRAGPLALFGCLFFFYGGTETALGAWLTEHARRLGGPAPVWGLATAAFWGGLTAGRAALAAGVSGAREDRAVLSGLALATGSIVLLLIAGDEWVVTVGAAGAGLGLAPVFPVTVAVLAREGPGRLGGPLIATGGLGGASVPWLVGVVSTRTGSLGAGLRLVLATCGALLILHAVRARTRR